MTGKVAKLSTYGQGFAGGLAVRNLPVAVSHPGKVFYVGDSSIPAFPNRKTGSDGNTGSFLAPFATIDYAIGQCTANRGDVIFVLPDHEETISAASGITVDVAGVSIIGLGGYNAKPKLSYSAAASTIVVSAADVTLANLNLTAAFADVVAGVVVTAAGVSIVDVDFRDDAAAENWLTPIKATGTTDGEADGLRVEGCRWGSVDAAGLEFIELNADVTDLVVRGNVVAHEGTASPLVLAATGKDIKYCEISDNKLSHKMTANELLVNVDTTGTNNSGFINNNYVGHADVTGAHDLGIDSLGCRLFENYSVSTNALSGVLLPAADVDL